MPKDAKNVSHPNLKARVLPHNDEAEQAILGCVMIDENAPVTILSELTPDDFYSGAHKLIFTSHAVAGARKTSRWTSSRSCRKWKRWAVWKRWAA